jgi:hypothetical protein
LTQLQNWVTTYEPMIRARARIQHRLNQQGLTAIDEAFEHANSLGPLDPVTPHLPTQMSGLLFPTGFCPDIGSHTVHPALAWCPEPCLFGGRDGGLWEWPESSCHSLVGNFKIEFFFSHALWAVVRTLENPTTTTPLQQQHFLQPQK